MVKSLYPSINLSSSKPGAIVFKASAIAVHLPGNKSASVFLRAGAEIVSHRFSRPVVKPKITNWRIPSIESFDFVDGTDFDFVDGTPFDFVD